MLYLCSMNATKTPSILIIYTGGTIGMTENPETGALMNFDFEKFQLYVPELKRFPYHIDSYTFNPPIDSSDMEPKYWVKMTQVIADNYDQYDGFVVLHGTDTMAFTASALSFMVFVLLYCPCIASVAAIVKETGKLKYGAFSVIYNTLVAWLAAFIVYTIASLFL